MEMSLLQTSPVATASNKQRAPKLRGLGYGWGRQVGCVTVGFGCKMGWQVVKRQFQNRGEACLMSE
jgi:hypothetical protein